MCIGGCEAIANASRSDFCLPGMGEECAGLGGLPIGRDGRSGDDGSILLRAASEGSPRRAQRREHAMMRLGFGQVLPLDEAVEG